MPAMIDQTTAATMELFHGGTAFAVRVFALDNSDAAIAPASVSIHPARGPSAPLRAGGSAGNHPEARCVGAFGVRMGGAEARPTAPQLR